MKKKLFLTSLFIGLMVCALAFACTFCNGTGIYNRSCATCLGSGYAWNIKCVRCNGVGTIAVPCRYCKQATERIPWIW